MIQSSQDGSHVIVETQTSKYRLSTYGDIYKLEKVLLKKGHTSIVAKGEVFFLRKADVYLWSSCKDQYNLVFGDMHTSPVSNSEEVKTWLAQNK